MGRLRLVDDAIYVAERLSYEKDPISNRWYKINEDGSFDYIAQRELLQLLEAVEG